MKSFKRITYIVAFFLAAAAVGVIAFPIMPVSAQNFAKFQAGWLIAKKLSVSGVTSMTGAVTTASTITAGGKITTPASATGGAGLILPPGTAPSSPANGDIWTTSAGLYARINGATIGPYSGTGGGGVVPLANGGTGQTDKAAAFNALSPMSALGDVVYGGTSGAGTRLAGDTSDVKKFLRSQSSTGTATAPAWDTIASGDLTTALTTPPAIGGTTPQAGTFTALTATGLTTLSAGLTSASANTKELPVDASIAFTPASATETIAADGVIHPTRPFVKITAASPVTGSTITAIADGWNSGQILTVLNVGTNAITVKNNANTKIGADLALAQNDSLSVWWNGTDWVRYASADN
jgi:hypothetical protein